MIPLHNVTVVVCVLQKGWECALDTNQRARHFRARRVAPLKTHSLSVMIAMLSCVYMDSARDGSQQFSRLICLPQLGVGS